MGDVSAFMKELKQRFSRWYNKTMGRFGTLWAERFTSVVVEDSTAALRTVAAYIDLNPIRAGLVQEPKDFVNEMFTRHRDRFSARRKDGARPIRGVPLPGICVMRDLRVDAIG